MKRVLLAVLAFAAFGIVMALRDEVSSIAARAAMGALAGAIAGAAYVFLAGSRSKS